MSQGEQPAGPATFEDLYAEHAAAVKTVLWLQGVKGEHEREEVAQEVWIDVHRSLATYDPTRARPRAWIAGIARNAARDWHRARRRHPADATATDQEVPDLRATTTHLERAQHRAALLAHLCRAVPNEDQREAFVLHDVVGLTVAEVAEKTGCRVWTAQWRLKMARIKVREAEQALTEEERDKLRAVVVPVVGVGALASALRSTVSDEELARDWDRLSRRIALEGGVTSAPVGTPATPSASMPAPRPYMLTGGQLAAGVAGVFLAGAIAGAGSLYAYLKRDRAVAAMIVTEAPLLPVSTRERVPEPAPTTSAPVVPGPAPSAMTPASSTWESESLLNRARNALVRAPEQALAFANEHAQRFPTIKVEQREEIAVRALLQLGRRPEAEDRAAKLVRWTPSMRPTMDSVLAR